MGRFFNEITRLLLVISKMVFGDERSLTATFLIFGEHKHT